MKINLSFLVLLLSITVVSTSCKKDKDDPKSYFTYEGKTYATTHAQNMDQGGYASTVFSSVNATATSGKINAVNILFGNPELIAGTFTFKEDDDPEFDGSKHFFDAIAIIDVALSSQGHDMESGTIVDQITAGTVTVSKDGSNFNVVYELNFNGKIISGKYSRAIQQM